MGSSILVVSQALSSLLTIVDSDLVLIRIYKLLDLLSRIIKISTANGGLFRFFKNDASFTIY